MTHPTRTRPGVGIRVTSACISMAVILALTLAPRPTVAAARASVMDLLHRVADAVVGPMSFDQLEGMFNALLFVPLGAALALLLSKRLWALAPLGVFIVSVTVEHVQSAIPGRVPDVHDTMSNAFGGLLGAIIAALARLIHGRIRRRSGRTRPAPRPATDASPDRVR